MWILWSERNCRTLEDAEESKFQMKISFIRNLVNGYFIQKKKNLSEWSIVTGLSDSSTITEFTELLSFACKI